MFDFYDIFLLTSLEIFFIIQFILLHLEILEEEKFLIEKFVFIIQTTAKNKPLYNFIEKK